MIEKMKDKIFNIEDNNVKSLYSFFDGKNIEDITLCDIKLFFDFQCEYLGVDSYNGNQFGLDFKMLKGEKDYVCDCINEHVCDCEKKFQKNQKKIKKSKEYIIKVEVSKILLEMIKENLKYLSECKDKYIFNDQSLKMQYLLKEGILNQDSTNKKENIKISFEGEVADIGTYNDLIKIIKEENEKIINKNKLEAYKKCYKNQKESFEKILNIDKGLKSKKNLTNNGTIFGGNMFGYFSRLSFEFNDIFVPKEIIAKEKKSYGDFGIYESDEDVVYSGQIVRSDDYQMFIRQFNILIDGLYGSKDIYYFITEKEISSIKTYNDFKIYDRNQQRNTKFGYIQNSSKFYVSNLLLYIIFDIIQDLKYGDKNYINNIKQVKFSLIEKTDIIKMKLVDVASLFNDGFYLGFKEKMNYGLEKYTENEKKIISDTLMEMTDGGTTNLDEEVDFEIDLYDTDKNNKNKYINKNYERFIEKHGIGSFKNKLFDFIIENVNYKNYVEKNIGVVGKKDVEKQKHRITKKQKYFSERSF